MLSDVAAEGVDHLRSCVVEALQAEVAQLKEELATLLKLKAWMPQSCEPSPEPAALANPHKDDPRWSVHNARLRNAHKNEYHKRFRYQKRNNAWLLVAPAL